MKSTYRIEIEDIGTIVRLVPFESPSEEEAIARAKSEATSSDEWGDPETAEVRLMALTPDGWELVYTVIVDDARRSE